MDSATQTALSLRILGVCVARTLTAEPLGWVEIGGRGSAWCLVGPMTPSLVPGTPSKPTYLMLPINTGSLLGSKASQPGSPPGLVDYRVDHQLLSHPSFMRQVGHAEEAAVEAPADLGRTGEAAQRPAAEAVPDGPEASAPSASEVEPPVCAAAGLQRWSRLFCLAGWSE